MSVDASYMYLQCMYVVARISENIQVSYDLLQLCYDCQYNRLFGIH